MMPIAKAVSIELTDTNEYTYWQNHPHGPHKLVITTVNNPNCKWKYCVSMSQLKTVVSSLIPYEILHVIYSYLCLQIIETGSDNKNLSHKFSNCNYYQGFQFNISNIMNITLLMMGTTLCMSYDIFDKWNGYWTISECNIKVWINEYVQNVHIRGKNDSKDFATVDVNKKTDLPYIGYKPWIQIQILKLIYVRNLSDYTSRIELIKLYKNNNTMG